nr:hypothetical protein [uncultured Desulfobacter sp.]
MRTKIGVLIVGFVFLFAMVLAGCGDQDKSNQAPITPEAEVTVPEADVPPPEDEAAPPEVEKTDPEVQAEKMAPKTDTEPQEASTPEKE